MLKLVKFQIKVNLQDTAQFLCQDFKTECSLLLVTICSLFKHRIQSLSLQLSY